MDQVKFAENNLQNIKINFMVSLNRLYSFNVFNLNKAGFFEGSFFCGGGGVGGVGGGVNLIFRSYFRKKYNLISIKRYTIFKRPI